MDSRCVCSLPVSPVSPYLRAGDQAIVSATIIT